MITPEVAKPARFQIAACIFIAITSVFIVRFNRSPLNQNETVELKRNEAESEGRQVAVTNHIVRFREYRLAEEHLVNLKRSVKEGGWEWIERRNPAARFPTDFGLVAIEDSVREGLVEEFRDLEFVKDVTVDRSFKKELLEEKGRSGGFEDVEKHPGKMFTAMSFDEGDDHFGRHLNMQVCFI